MRKHLSVDKLTRSAGRALGRFLNAGFPLLRSRSDPRGIAKLPDDPERAITAGSRLCEELLEPPQAHFGRIAFPSEELNGFANAMQGGKWGCNCASNEANFAHHI